MTVAAEIVAEIVADITDIEPWRPAWEALFARSGKEPSVSYEWTSALLRSHARPGDRVYLLILKQSDRIVGLIPLIARQDRFLGQTLTTLSPLSERYNTHTDLLIDADPAGCLDALLNALAGKGIRWDVFRAGRLLEQEDLSVRLERQLRSSGFAHRIQFSPPSFFMDLPGSMNEYLAQRSGKFRNYLRRTEKKIATLGDVAFEVVDNDADIDLAYRKMLQIEANSWKHEHGTAITAVGHQTAFYRDLCFGAAAADRLHLSLLHINGEPVAYNLGYLNNQRYSYLKTSYDERLRSAGVATLARARLVEQLIGQGARSLDFPGEPYEWEQQWTDVLRWHTAIAVYNNNLRARTFHLLSEARRILKKQPAGKSFEFCDARALQPPTD